MTKITSALIFLFLGFGPAHAIEPFVVLQKNSDSSYASSEKYRVRRGDTLAKIVAPHLHLLFFSCFIIELCRVSEHGILRAAKERHHAVSIVCGTADGAGTTKDASTSSSRLTWRVQV